jgi:hypothetical protein
VRPPRVNERALRAFARRFELAGTEKRGLIARDARALHYSEGPHQVRLHIASGGARYYDTLRWQVDDGESNVELSDRQAINAADRYVQARRLASSEDYRVLRVARLNVAAADRESGEVEQRVIDAAVAFQRVVDGIPVDGPGGKIVVYLDHKRQATGCERLWRDLGATKRHVDVRPPEDALSTLRRRWAQRREGVVEVTDFRFGYFELGWNDTQTALEPAYVALLTLALPDEPFRVNKVEVIPASPQATAGLVPPPKRRRAPSRRSA